MHAETFWREECRRFFDRNYGGRDLRALPPTSYLVELLARAPIDVRGGSILDLGCGGGNNLRWLAQRHLARRAVGVERSPETVGLLAEAFPEYEFIAADVTDLPFDDDGFDLVVIRSLLCWVEPSRLLQTLGEALRVCGDWLVVSEYAPRRAYSVPYRYEPEMRTWKGDVKPLLDATGLLREQASLVHHDGDEWNCARTTLYRKLPVADAFPLREERELRRPIDPDDVAHAARVLAEVGEMAPPVPTLELLPRAAGRRG
jgi:SAM-dependent methyltransferase